MASTKNDTLSILNSTPRKLPGPNNLHNLVTSDKGHDDAAAIEYLSPDGQIERWSYRQMHEAAEVLARVLLSKLETGAQAGAKQHRRIIPLLIEQCPLLYIAELAILKAGAAFCPLPLDVPEDRLRFILGDIEATLLLTTSKLRVGLPALASVVIVLADDYDTDTTIFDLPEHVDSTSPAYVMYTSGSTGKPKGVILSHSAATQALLAHERHIPTFSRFLQFASPTFDVSVFEIFFPLFRGCTLICGERRRILNDLSGFITSMDIDAAELTPSVASSLLRGRDQVPSLRLLLTIGEMLKRDVIEQYAGSRDQKSILFGMYGPTEATIHCTLQPSFTSDMPAGNIGVPLDTVSAFVVRPQADDGNQSNEIEILPFGEEGELAVGGYQLADGYLNRPEQTKAAFVTHPEFGSLYLTGDRVRLTQDGNLECSGRISNGQVKLRGQRIELGEIEYAAGQTDGCQTAVAEIVAGSLVAFCIFSSEPAEEYMVRESCRKWLPAFMVPANILILDELPYLDSGKVDRKALQALYKSRKAQSDGHVTAEEIELQPILDVITNVIGGEVHAQTSLAAAGLDSLSSIRISAELKRAGYAYMDSTVILESNTARDIAAKLRKRGLESEKLDSSTDLAVQSSTLTDSLRKSPMFIDRIQDVDHVYLSTVTQSSMLLETLRNNRAYCNWIELEVSGTYNAQQVSHAIHQLARAHSLLRSGFIAVDGFRSGHAVVTWKELEPYQVTVVEEFDYDFNANWDKDLLHPCMFQIKQTNRQTRILLQIHHALYDQWSVDSLRWDLSDVLAGHELPSRLSFKDVSDFQHKQLLANKPEDDLDFWSDLLRDFNASPIPAIIGQRVEPGLVRSGWYDLDCNIVDIRNKARDLQCSVPAIFQSAMAFLLGSYVASTDVTFGVVLSGRHLPIDNIENVFGPCLTTLPLRLDYSSVRTCADLARLVQARNRAMQKHSLVPLVDIKGVVEKMGSSQLFDTLFVWQESTLTQTDGELLVREVDSADQHEYNLVLEVAPTSHGVQLRATFQQSLLPPGQVDHIASQMNYYVKRIIAEPSCQVQELGSCLSDALLSIANPSPQDCSVGRNLVDRIEQHAKRIPSSTAIMFATDLETRGMGLQGITYRELNDRSNQVARCISSRAMQTSELVGIYMEKSINLYIAILAAIKAGFGYLPIVPDTPHARMQSIMRQISVALWICDDTTHAKLRVSQDVSSMNVDNLNLSDIDIAGLNIDFPDDRIAYTVFTSGSTGEPKGVPVTMKNLLGNLDVLSSLYPMTDGDRLLQACSHAFDVSVFEIFFTFYNGLCLCSAPKQALFEDFEASIRHFSITHLSLTPTVAALVDPKAVPSVKFLVTAGEGITNVVHSTWAGKGLHQGYGPSETTNICSVKMHVSPQDVLGNIGPPLRNTSAFVVSTGSNLEILPVGAFGELAFGGEQVFPGYVGLPELNATKIVSHPRFGRLYRSGDIGRILSDGTMLIQGRSDDQVKLRGNRIELGEINSVLLRSELIRDCTTLIVGQEATTQSIASLIVLHSRPSHTDSVSKGVIEDNTATHLFQLLERLLPSYMVPSTITIIHNMPRTSQGKLDYGALRDMVQQDNTAIAKTFRRESDDIDDFTEWSVEETKIAEVLAQLLRIKTSSMTRRTSLLSIGLNSLNAISFARHLSRELSTRVSVGTVLGNPSISKLAHIIRTEGLQDAAEANQNDFELLPPEVTQYARNLHSLRRRDVEHVLPCTPLQEAMLSASAASANRTYWNKLTLRVHGDVQELRRCWEHMVQRHGILRTRFLSTHDRRYPFVQVVLNTAKLLWNDLRTSSRRALVCPSTVLHGSEHDLRESSPFYIDYSNEGGQPLLAVHMHHAIYDGVSLARLLKEVQSNYKRLELRPPPSFEPYLREAAMHAAPEAIAYWSEEVKDFLPRPLQALVKGTHAEEHCVKDVLPAAVADLNQLCKHHSISLLAVFQTALAKTLLFCQSATDICFGNVTSGRTVPVNAVEELVAPCFNTIPVRIKLHDNDSNIQIASQLHRKNIASLRYQLTPLRRIQALSQLPSKRLFDCLLILQPPQEPLDSSIWTMMQESGDMGLPLVFEIVPGEDNIHVFLHYSERYVTKSNARLIWETFSMAIATLLKYPSGSMRDFANHDTSQLAGVLAVEEDTDEKTVGATARSSDWSSDELLVCDVFAHLTGLPKQIIKTDTSIFQIGLDSLNAPQVASQLRSKGLRIDAGDVLECLTPAAIARRSQDGSSDQHVNRVDLKDFDRKHRARILKSARVPSSSVEAVWPCTPIQSGMLLQSMQSNGKLYTNHITYRIPNSVSTSRLRDAWALLAEKYQVLRMGFHKIDDTSFPFAMSIFKEHSIAIPFIERSDKASVNETETQGRDRVLHSINRHPWSVQIIRQNSELLMTLSLHHALYDADSLKSILDDLAKSLRSNKLDVADNIEHALVANLNASLDSSPARDTFWSTALQNVALSKFPDLAPAVVTSGDLEYQDHEIDISSTVIDQFCKTHNATIQALGQTIWALLLSAYVGDGNVVFGTIFSGLPSSSDTGAAFPSITTIPISCNASRAPRDLLDQMVHFNASAYRHRFMPLAEIQRLAGAENNPLFDTVFVHQKTSKPSASFNWTIVAETASVDYVASLELQTAEEGPTNLRLTHRVDKIPSSQAYLILQQYEHLLKQILFSENDRPNSLYSILPAKQPELPSPATLLHRMVEHAVSNHPHRKALSFLRNSEGAMLTSESWTYRQLNDRANQVANLIRQGGVAPGSIVAVCMQKSPEASFAFLGILKAGCSFLAIDPDLPQARLEFILEDSAAKLLFVNEDELPELKQGLVRCMELRSAILENYPVAFSDIIDIEPEATCYCLYTSGTTGTPKGCEVTHENAVQAMMSFQRLFAGHWTENSRWLQFASYWFDVSVLEQFWSWAVGIEVVGAPRDVVLEDLPGFLSRQKITHIDLTPSLARLVNPEDVPSIWGGVFITGGEALKQEIIDAWGPKATICNGYGPTEATIGVTMNTFVREDAKPTNIGRQFDNVGAFVLQLNSDEPVLRGAVGELCVSGKLVGKGYLNRPELTASQFPTLAKFGERVYRTGDLVRVLADGSFSFIGRQDSQAKLRGQRLETAEIDNVIQNSSSDIAHTITLIAKTGSANKETLVSYLTKTARSQTHELALDFTDEALYLVQMTRQACVDRLPGYMVPTHVLPINYLPLTVNNKVDTKRLLQLFSDSSTKDLQRLCRPEDNASSMNASEQRIVACLCEVLSIEGQDLTKGSNLFSLGLSSISAIAFAGLLKKKGFKKSSVAMVMSNPTITRLSEALIENANDREIDDDSVEQAKLSLSAFAKRHTGSAARALGISSDQIEVVAPCTPIQQGMVLDSLRFNDHPYFNDFCYVLSGIGINKVRNALHELVGRTQMLRARFIDTDHGTIQVVLKSIRAPISEWVETKSTNLTSRLQQLKSTWIDKNRDTIIQPFEVHFIQSNELHYLKIHMHHALYDGISFDLLIRNLIDLCSNKASNNSTPTFTQALPYGPLRQLKSAQEFWQSRLDACRPHALSPVQSTTQQTTVALSATIDTSLIEVVRKQLGVSHQAVMQGCFEIAIRRCMPTIRVYGTVVSGRSIELPGADQILGPMFNTLPQPLRLAANSTFAEHVRSRHDDSVKTLPYQHTSLRDIRKWAGWNSADSMFDVLFVFQHMSASDESTVNSMLEEVDHQPEAHYPLSCEIEMSDDGEVTIFTVAQTTYFDSETVHSLLDGIEEVLMCLVNDPDSKLTDRFEIETEPASPFDPDRTSEREQMDGIEHFEWTQSALHVRSEMAALLHLDANEIDEHSSLFSLGLDSIDAVKLASRLRKAGLVIPVSKILKAQTIPRILEAAQEDQSNSANGVESSRLSQLSERLQKMDPSLDNVDLEEIESILPATPAQEALLADMHRTDFQEYFNHDVLRLRSNTDLGTLKQAWQAVVDQSPILRTIFTEISHPDIDAVYAQVVVKKAVLDFKEEQCDNGDFGAIFDMIRSDVRSNIHKKPPLRLTMVHSASDRYLILSLAHAQYDGHSLTLLHKDVHRACSNALRPRPSYRDVLDAALAGVSDEAVHFWTDTLSGVAVDSFPHTGPSEEQNQTHRNERITAISTSTTRGFCKQNSISMQALMQTCWALTLAHYTRRMEVVFGVVLACRDNSEAEEVMFPTMNTVALRASLHGTRIQMTQSLQSFSTDMLPYQRTPLRAIKAAVTKTLKNSEEPPENGLFDTLFIYQHRPDDLESRGKPLYDSVGGSSDVEYPVAVEMEATEDESVIIRAACRSSVLDEQGTKQLTETIEDVLTAIINAPQEPAVEFEEGEISICGMEPFYVDEFQDDVTHSEESEYEGNFDPEPSPSTTLMMEALSKVSKVPITDITPFTTIESIGIDSISAIKAAALLRKRDINLTVSDILRAKTPSRMAEKLESKQAQTPVSDQSSKEIISAAVEPYLKDNLLRRLEIEPNIGETILPATAGQVYMLNMWQKTNGQLFYATFNYQLTGKMKPMAINEAWKALTSHHPILRTMFCATGDRNLPALQVVLQNGAAASERQPMASLKAQRNETGYELSLSIHHALYDAVSLPLLMEDLKMLLEGGSLPSRLLTFEDFIAASSSHRSKQLRKHFWSDYFDEITPLSLRQPATNGPQKRVEIFKPALFTETDAVEKAVRAQNLSLQALLFAAYARVYTALAADSEDQKEDVILGIYLSNRSHLSNLETLAAPTVNLVPLLVRSPQQSSLMDVAKQVQEDFQKIGSVNYSAVGLWEIEQWTGIKVDTFVNFLKLPESDDEAVDRRSVTIHPLERDRLQERSHVAQPAVDGDFDMPKELEGMNGMDAYQHSLDIEMTITNNNLSVGLFCPESMVSLEQAEDALGEFKALLEKFVGKTKA